MHPPPASPVVIGEPGAAELLDDPLPPDAIVGGAPLPADAELVRSADRELVTGVWRCTPGRFVDVEVDETFIVLAGRATIEPDGGEPVEVGEGDVCVLGEGLRTTWTVHETLLKVYVLRDR